MSVSDTLNLIPGLWNFGAQLRSDWINRHGFLYAVDFEARLNLDKALYTVRKCLAKVIEENG